MFFTSSFSPPCSKASPYEHSPLGTRPSFDKTTGADLRKFHNTWYAPNNAILVIVGNVEPQTVLAQVKKVFGEIPAKPLPARPEFNFSPVTPDTLKLDTDLPYGMTAITFRFPGADNPDFAAAQILSDVLSSQRGKLYGLVPDGKALFATFEYETLQKSGLGYAIAGFPAGGDSTNLLNEVKGHSARRNHQRRQRRSGRSRQTPRNHQRRAAEKFRLRPGERLVHRRRHRRPQFAGRRHQSVSRRHALTT